MTEVLFNNRTGLFNLATQFDNASGKYLLQSYSNERGFIVEVLQDLSSRCTSWILLPGGELWSPEWKAILCLMALMWMFVGVAIAADIFVGSIEVITSQKKLVTTFDSERQEMVVREVLIWNDTVANLTLLALGSSIPEIMLATIEQVSKLSLDQSVVKDDLGTFTIVGSAAFNLLLISAVCIISVPSDKVSAIAEYRVFLTTAAWSVFAYLWLIITLQWISPGEVDIWEAVVTLLFFPMLVGHAWAQSKGWWRESSKEQRVRIVGLSLPRDGDTRAIALEDVEETLAMEMLAQQNETKTDFMEHDHDSQQAAPMFPSDGGHDEESGMQSGMRSRSEHDTNNGVGMPRVSSFHEAMGIGRTVMLSSSPLATDSSLVQLDVEPARRFHGDNASSPPQPGVLSEATHDSHKPATQQQQRLTGIQKIFVSQPSMPNTAATDTAEVGGSTSKRHSMVSGASVSRRGSNSSARSGRQRDAPSLALSPVQKIAVLNTLQKMKLVNNKGSRSHPLDNSGGSPTHNRSAAGSGEPDHLVAFSEESERKRGQTRARFRHAAMRSLVGGGVGSPGKRNKNHSMDRVANTIRSAQRWHSLVSRKRPAYSEGDSIGRVYFRDNAYTVIKSMGIVYLVVDVSWPVKIAMPAKDAVVKSRQTLSVSDSIPQARSDSAILDSDLAEVPARLVVHWETRDGTARNGKAYLKDGGVLVFNPGEITKRVSVTIATDDMYESDEEFYVILTLAEGVTLAEPTIAKVRIVDDDQPGTFLFDQPRYFTAVGDACIQLTVLREFGSDGIVEVKYHTLDGTGRGGKEAEGSADYAIQTGVLVFQSRETSKEITVPINQKSMGQHKNFVVSLKSVSKGALLGDQSASICILGDDDDPIVTRVARFISPDEEEELSWASQFETALTLTRDIGPDGEPEPIPGRVLFLHFISVFWKLLFAFIPPRHYWNGKPCFLVSLFFIGGLTALIEQFATILGCAISLRTSATGITIIALGTSLPDTFASRAAALQDRHADAAIGNITGSNSVNVFLGLGVPWLIASIFHSANGSTYKVSNKNLSFSVFVFIICALGGLVVLTVRRRYYGGELGGPRKGKWISAIVLISLWLLYLTLAICKAYNFIEGF